MSKTALDSHVRLWDRRQREPFAAVNSISPSKSRGLSIAHYLLITLLAAAPILAIANGAFAQHMVALVAAMTMAMAARSPQAELASAAQLLKQFLPVVLLPIVWMALQIFPAPTVSLANQIWSATSVALNQPSLPGRISVAPGATLQSLFHYLVAVSLVVSTVIITKDRHRAETILFALCAVTTFMSIEVLLHRFGLFTGMISGTSAATSPFSAAAALAVLANGALVARALEHHLHQQDIHNLASLQLWVGVLSGLFGIAVAFAAMATLERGALLAVTGWGLTVLVFIAAVRRLGFRSWPSAILFSILAAMAGLMALPHSQSGGSSLLGFANLSPEAVAPVKHLLSDAPLLGNGIGTFGLTSMAYQEFGVGALAIPPSTAIMIAIESGRLAIVVLAGFAAQLFFVSFRGAVRRGRDFFFAAAAAAGILVVLCESFLDSSLSSPTIQIVVAVMVGLGLAQSVGRTSVRQPLGDSRLAP
ncbi:O-antigen ligase family protein [Bradyrhizobium sp. UFLA05-112]